MDKLVAERKVTVYSKGGMGNIVRTECREVEVERAPYAQYRGAIHVRLTPKGKRNRRGFVETYESDLLVLEGHGHPAPEGLFGEAQVDANTGLAVSRSHYSAFDPRWASDFAEMIDRYVKETGAKVLWDSRGERIS